MILMLSIVKFFLKIFTDFHSYGSSLKGVWGWSQESLNQCNFATDCDGGKSFEITSRWNLWVGIEAEADSSRRWTLDFQVILCEF